ncbi:bifunctional DNA primase/polymerase [Streptomyces sp. NBC_00233]|uniref:bifunctional DNA primase/polymerase n=1 Tax=Streptomyces sp. NBC_00233 TaxID=2975686 RepID=UPI0022578C20|nr:bifunctional DNA primase/polymerase [Streptomyces sp. NBC_00233]MCX5226276.1 bifunctional DNA primase/polymerase [Streptomyces sp. NBC_00233]
MTHAIPIRRDARYGYLDVALRLAVGGLPVLPLRAGKGPFGNCPACESNACGGRPNMKTPGPCMCPRPCHAWAAATTDTHVLASSGWAAVWRGAGVVGYHPGGAGVTVVDLDDADAVRWARAVLPATRTVTTTRGEHWIYRGAMRSANHVRPGVDIKSAMSYARWLGPGAGAMAVLPSAVLALVEREETTRAGGAVDSSSVTRARWDRSVATGCRHTETYVRTGLARGVEHVRARSEKGAGTAAYGAAGFLAKQHTACPGPCGLDLLGEDLIDAAVSVGVPEPYARRAVSNGLQAALGATA